MADKKISALTGASTPLAGTEVLPIVQSGATVKATVANIVGAGTSPGSFTTIAGTGPVTIKQTSDYSSAGSGVNVVKSNTTDVWTIYVAADTSYSVAYGATLGASNRLWVYDTTGNLIPQTAAKGVNFTANTPAAGMTSQLLNWYEEGTWTPTVSGGVGSPTYTTQVGKYTKIGRLVYFSIALKLSGGTPAAGQIRFSGLPFTTENAAPYGAGFIGFSGNFVTAGTTVYIPSNNTRIDFYKSDGTVFAGTDSPAITGDIYINGFYIVA